MRILRSAVFCSEQSHGLHVGVPGRQLWQHLSPAVHRVPGRDLCCDAGVDGVQPVPFRHIHDRRGLDLLLHLLDGLLLVIGLLTMLALPSGQIWQRQCPHLMLLVPRRHLLDRPGCDQYFRVRHMQRGHLQYGVGRHVQRDVHAVSGWEVFQFFIPHKL